MKNWLFNLLNENAVLTSSVLGDGKTNMAYCVVNNASSYVYSSMAVGNGTQSAIANDTAIIGNYSYHCDVNGSFVSSYKASWTHTFGYTDMNDSHVFSEAMIIKNATEREGYGLARIVYDPITLNESDTLEIEIRVNFS